MHQHGGANPNRSSLDGSDQWLWKVMYSEKKIKYWAYGSYEMANANLSGIQFISNPRNGKNPYYAKSINLQF